MDFVIISSLIGLVYLVGANIANWVIVGGLGASIASGAMLIVGLVAIAFCRGGYAFTSSSIPNASLTAQTKI